MKNVFCGVKCLCRARERIWEIELKFLFFWPLPKRKTENWKLIEENRFSPRHFHIHIVFFFISRTWMFFTPKNTWITCLLKWSFSFAGGLCPDEERAVCARRRRNRIWSSPCGVFKNRCLFAVRFCFINETCHLKNLLSVRPIKKTFASLFLTSFPSSVFFFFLHFFRLYIK